VVQDSVKAAAEVWRAATDAEQGMHRYGVLLSQLPSSVGNAVGAIQQLVLRMESTHAAVQATVRPAAPAPRRTSNELMTLLAGSHFHPLLLRRLGCRTSTQPQTRLLQVRTELRDYQS